MKQHEAEGFTKGSPGAIANRRLTPEWEGVRDEGGVPPSPQRRRDAAQTRLRVRVDYGPGQGEGKLSEGSAK